MAANICNDAKIDKNVIDMFDKANTPTTLFVCCPFKMYLLTCIVFMYIYKRGAETRI